MPTYSAYSGTAFATTPPAPTPRTGPNVFRMFMLAPSVVFAARVNAPVSTYPLSEIPYDGVTTGAFGDIEIGQTVHIGTTPGNFDLGIQRIRAASDAGKLYIGRSSQGVNVGEVDLQDNAYITVFDLFEVWSRPPYIDADEKTWKDPGFLVEWRTTTPPPVCNIGCGVARTIDAVTGEIAVAFDAGGSYGMAGATITAWAWDVKDGTVVSGTAASETLVVSFPAGFRWVSCTVTDSAGHASTMRVPVFARDPDADLCIPFEFSSNLRVGRDGQSLSVRVRREILASTHIPGTLLMLWRGEPEDVFDRSHMIFPCAWLGEVPAEIGAVDTGTLRQVELEFVDVAGRLKQLPGYGMVLEGAAAPSEWEEMYAPDVGKYMQYLLAWHSTALSLADFFLPSNMNTYPFKALSSEGETLWEQVSRRALALSPDHVFTCNSRGQLRVAPDPSLQELADRTVVVQAHFTAADWTSIRYVHRRNPPVHWMRSNAVLADPDNISLLFAVAPGDAPGQGGQEVTHGDQLARSQVEFNRVEGHRYARLTERQRTFFISFARGEMTGVEPADMTWVELTLPPELAAPRGFSLPQQRGLPLEVVYSFQQDETGIRTSAAMTWQRETSGLPAITYIPPDSAGLPTDDTTWPGDFHGTPPPETPYLPPYDPPIEILQTWTFIDPVGDAQSVGWVGKNLSLDNPTEQWDTFAIAYVYNDIANDGTEQVMMVSGGVNPSLTSIGQSIFSLSTIGGDPVNRLVGVRAYQARGVHDPDNQVHVRWPSNRDTVLSVHIIHMRGVKHSSTDGSGAGSQANASGSQGYGNPIPCEPTVVINDVEAVLQAGSAPVRIVPTGSFIFYSHAEATTGVCAALGATSAGFPRIIKASAADWEIGYWGTAEFLGFAQEAGPWTLAIADSVSAGTIGMIAALSLAPEVPPA